MRADFHLVLRRYPYSLLCQGEPNHESVRQFVRQWLQVRGTVAIAPPVLEEIVHHANIAQIDMSLLGSSSWFPGTKSDYYLFTNAFARAFAHLVRTGKARRNQWSRYISQFRGVRRVCEQLVDKGVTIIDGLKGEAELAKKVTRSLLAGRDGGKREQDKAKRDGRLLAICQLLNQQGDKRHYIVSSSFRLQRVADRYSVELGISEREPVLSLSAAMYFISLVPGVSLSMDSLRRILFDQQFYQRVSPVEQAALRLIREAKDHSLTWAERRTLMRELNAGVMREASRRHVSQGTVKKALLRASEHGDMSEAARDSAQRVIVEAIQALDEPRNEEVARQNEELAALQRTVKALTKKAERLESENRKLKRRR